MDKFSGKLSDNSIWLTVTPTQLTKTLPFYITEAGHFSVYSDYMVKRDFHDSFLFLYTVCGAGCVKSIDVTVQLPKGCAMIIDCHTAHEYFSQSDEWDFLWIHFGGLAAGAMLEVIYPNNSVRSINMESENDFKDRITSIIDKVIKNDVRTCIDISSQMHMIINAMYTASIEIEENNQKKESADDIRTVLEYIKNNYSRQISIDDMVDTIHISKYHFIRRFNRMMGVTPYNYLTNYRITMAKTMLRTTDKTVAEIAEECGFMDTSNFITKFKKRTNQKPLQYRHDFT